MFIGPSANTSRTISAIPPWVSFSFSFSTWKEHILDVCLLGFFFHLKNGDFDDFTKTAGFRLMVVDYWWECTDNISAIL